jgi:hypothetical protein
MFHVKHKQCLTFRKINMVRYSSSNTKGTDDEHYDVGVAARLNI